MKEYQILEECTPKSLEDLVVCELSKGWQLQGGVSVVRWETEDTRKGYTEPWFLYVQALVKDD